MKEFNITGTCIPERHYMVDTSKKIQKIINLIDRGKYFTINRPRQFGKTTTLSQLYHTLKQNLNYIVLRTSFEGIGDESFESPQSVSIAFLEQIKKALKVYPAEGKYLLDFTISYNKPTNFTELSNYITDLVNQSNRKIVLMIDEVDKASNHNIFLNFLGMLRNKYLNAADGMDQTFHSVILAGVHDIKNIKKKIISSGKEQAYPIPTYNSPWNIAADFDIDMSFSADEIETMLTDYVRNWGEGIVTRASSSQTEGFDQDGRSTIYNKTSLNVGIYPDDRQLITSLSKEIHKYTSGYPFLVSKICKLIDEKLDKDWSIEGIQNAINLLLVEQNTLFDDLIKNIENNPELSELLFSIMVEEEYLDYNIDNPIIQTGTMYGIFKCSEEKEVVLHNKIFELRIYAYLISKQQTLGLSLKKYNYRKNFIDKDGSIDMERLLLKFQQFVKETYSYKDETFYERHGRLLLIAFVKPIINGEGFYYIEPQQSYERRSDMIITFNKKEYILEFKLWYGQKYHEEGLKQLASYLDSRSHSTGYLVAFNFNKNKEFTNQWNEVDGKKIFEVIV